MSLEEAHANAALVLASLALPQQSQCSVATPMVKSITKRSWEGAQQENRNQDPLLYVGVTLERPAKGWGMTLFRMSHYLIVGGIQQEVMQRFTSWAWATTVPPRGGGVDFRSSFGPLFPTSLLQIVPGDVILSINGESQFDSSMWHAPRLNILAVRLESARRAAYQVLCMNVENAEYKAAQIAFETMEPMLPRTVVPKACQRQLFPASHSAPQVQVARNVEEKQMESASDESLMLTPMKSFPEWLTARKTMWREGRKQKRKRSHDDDGVHLPLTSPSGSTTQFHQWLQVRKNQWRNDRAKRRRLSAGTVQQSAAWLAPQEPLVFLCFKLVRDGVTAPWGIHVSHHDGRLLGVGHVSDAVPARTNWGWATTSPISGALLKIPDGRVIRSLFESQPLHSSSSRYLQEGDFILSVAGRPVSSFASLADVANHMKQTTSLMIIAVRHRVSSEVAQSALREGKTATEISGAAFRHLMPILYHSPIAVTWLFSHRAPVHRQQPAPVIAYRNPLFRDDQGIPILYEDVYDLEDGDRAAQFLPPISLESFPSWLKERKVSWRKQWNIRPIDSDGEWCDGDVSSSVDFWTQQGFPTFSHWLAASTFKWKQSYSWNQKKRERVARVCEEVVHFPSSSHGRDDVTVHQARDWLRVRKQQWRLLRRKRQRRLEEQASASSLITDDCCPQEGNEDSKPASRDTEHGETLNASLHSGFLAVSPRSVVLPRQTSGEMTIIDALLEEQEREAKVFQERPPLDISFLFDARLGAPDDVVTHCLEFLPRSEHGKLLCVSTETSAALKERDGVWRQLCPGHWVLPRRPRKRWHEVYITKIREEERASRKWADDFLNKASNILFNADHLNKIEKLVKQGEKRVDFNINYISGVVCERNSLLNLAVIYNRKKVVRWLLETKNADIETYDRGGFTPLLNASWSGDRALVRYLLSHGADRSKIGYCHFFEPLAPPEFKGLNAEGWARKKGHHELADLIRLGL